MKQYCKYVLSALFGLVTKITSLHVLVTFLDVSYHLAYPIITVAIVILNYSIINRVVFSIKKPAESQHRLLKFLALSSISLGTGWLIASGLYILSNSIILATIISGAITTTINFYISKNKIWNTATTQLSI